MHGDSSILENATGVGAPPQSWPRRELAVDILHKCVYGFTTRVVAHALASRDGPGPGQRHAALRAGRHADVGPLPRDAARARGVDPADRPTRHQSPAVTVLLAGQAAIGWAVITTLSR
ncbi:hypothetical protein [Dactylosporangium sp. NPDC000521]|uniref:hypothetical protein n=1 Tax=Dactylosporangium sp. NPDC000521 TaxID=3363975 RepID=UPI00367523C9